MNRAQRRLRPVGLAGTTVAHSVMAALLVVGAQRATTPPPNVYAVELIAAPLPTDSPRRAPDEAPPVAADEVVPIDPVLPRPVPATPPPPTPPDVPPKTDRQLQTRTPVQPLPGETPSSGQDVANVKIIGFESRYQGYVRNIVIQVRNRWQRPLGSSPLTAEISFLILRDGSVREIEFIKRSGNYSFDTGARGAIEGAGEAKAFGPLPAAFEGDALPISFYFTPAGARP